MVRRADLATASPVSLVATAPLRRASLGVAAPPVARAACIFVAAAVAGVAIDATLVVRHACNDAKKGVSSKRMRHFAALRSRGSATPSSVTQALYIWPVSVSLQHETNNGEKVHMQRHADTVPHTLGTVQ